MKIKSIPKIIAQAFSEHMSFIFTDRFFFVSAVLNPLAFSVLFYFIYKGHPTEQMLLGILRAGLLGLWGANIWSASFILEGEKRLRTLDYLMVSPTPLALILAGKALAKMVASLVSMLISLLWVQVFIGSIWVYFDIGRIIGIILACSFAFNAVGLMIAVLFINLQEPDVYGSLFIYPIYILSGIAGGFELFPVVLQHIAKVIPLYWANQGIYNLLIHENSFVVLGILISLGILYLGLATYFLSKVERRARWTGKFSLY